MSHDPLASHRSVGVGLVVAGCTAFLALVAVGSIRHPLAAAARTTPAEFVAIGASFTLVVLGLIVWLAASLPE
ncbi:hypothetical protein C479_13518 [Halovivax asiaticus JCM 14624]|uniref:Uncharacterized protein n=1 Tax=Halovivax asiaticus JCM 14624 TaxID=1227490 RepID=M0BBS0_9EURY|nr:hypothetical protein [Halovivax asiaticus]ELZ08361.1 hypothetical protein C479_13518 [Halovivax asiaticus JCM 14624]